MGLTSAVHWWEESQMRVLILSSLVVQSLLLIFSFARRNAIHKLFRFIMWIAYLAGDAVAIYALATLFNRHKDQDRRGSSRLELELVWAPILLLHLGGHDGITAYNIEDNELWSRHLLTSVSQVTVAIYVFCKSWPPGGDKRLLQASILLFIPGVLKCFAKPWALKRASIKSLVSSSDSKRTAKKGKAGEIDLNSLEKYVKQAKAFVQEQKNKGNEAQSEGARVENGVHPPPQQAKQDKDGMDPFEEYVKRKSDFVRGEGRAQGERAPMEEDTKPTGRRNERRRAEILRREAYKLFVDLSSPYAGRRLSIFKYFWVISQEKAETATTGKSKEEGDKAAPPDSSKKEDQADTVYGYVRRGLASAFLLLYTKLKTAIPTGNVLETDESPATVYLRESPATVIGRICLLLIMASRVYLPWAAIGLFHKSHREAYSDTDVKITYAILCCTAVLEVYSIGPILFTARDICPIWFTEMDISTVHHPLFISREQWPEMVAQYSLIGYFARNQNHSNKMKILSKLGCKDLVDQHWCMKPCLSSRRITELVLQYLKAGWEKKIQDVASYRSFIDTRGQWALEGNEGLNWSIKGPFDESVLLWHIATDLCFFFSSPFSEHIRVCDFAKVPSTWQSLLEYLDLKVLIPTKTSASKKCGQRLAECKAVQCRQMSNYMVYLLFVNPEMLLPGTRRDLFTTAYNDLSEILWEPEITWWEVWWNVSFRVRGAIWRIKSIFSCHTRNEALWDQFLHWISSGMKKSEKEHMGRVISVMEDKSKKGVESEEAGSKEESSENFIHDAWALAQGLLALGDEKMWEVIQGVWVEMLCFSASRCRGYLHAKALGSGGEFLSYVWLLLFYMGMETLTERLQREREELPSRVANSNAAPPASDAHSGSGTASSSGSRIRSRAAPSPSHLHTGTSTSNSDEIQNMV